MPLVNWRIQVTIKPCYCTNHAPAVISSFSFTTFPLFPLSTTFLLLCSLCLDYHSPSCHWLLQYILHWPLYDMSQMATLATAHNVFKLTTLIAMKCKPSLSAPVPPLSSPCVIWASTECVHTQVHQVLSRPHLFHPYCFSLLPHSSLSSCLLSLDLTGSSASYGQMQLMHKPFNAIFHLQGWSTIREGLATSLSGMALDFSGQLEQHWMLVLPQPLWCQEPTTPLPAPLPIAAYL